MRRHLIALGVTLHLLAVGLVAMPNPSGGLNRAAWADPTIRAEIATWAAWLGTSPDALEDRMWTVATAWNRARLAVLRPLFPYYDYAGTWQSWKMFVAPHTHPTRMRIDVLRGSGWELVYLERSAEHRWLATVLANDRLRATTFRMGWPHYGRLRADFAAWVAERARDELPGARQIRVSFEKTRTRTPAEVRAGVPPEISAPLLRTIATVRR